MKALDLTGQTFGKLVIIAKSGEISSDGSRKWFCVCSCGTQCNYAANKLKNGTVTQCGDCGKANKVNGGPAPLDLSGKIFGKLIAIRRLQEKESDGSFLWNCRCECGIEVSVSVSDLNSAQKTMCGNCRILAIGNANRTHGMSNSRLYRIWTHMGDRVNNPNHEHYENYGGRNITICDRWKIFENFQADMGPTYQEDLTIDRINNDGNYDPSNCRWANSEQQARNRRNTIRLTHNGITQSVDDWADQFGISKATLLYRLNAGWSIEEILVSQKVR